MNEIEGRWRHEMLLEVLVLVLLGVLVLVLDVEKWSRLHTRGHGLRRRMLLNEVGDARHSLLVVLLVHGFQGLTNIVYEGFSIC